MNCGRLTELSQSVKRIPLQVIGRDAKEVKDRLAKEHGIMVGGGAWA